MLFPVSPARAQCAPDPAADGDTVTCAGNDADGFSAGAVNNLKVNVQPGATVLDNGTAAISVNDGNTVTNRGALTAGDFMSGVTGFNSNTFTNIGTITVGQSSAGLSVGDNSLVTNSGTVTGLTSSIGIFGGQNDIIGNSGTLNLGDNGTGIFVTGGSTVTNSGSIITGASFGFSGGIIAINDGNTIVNAAGASITGGQFAQGIFAQGNGVTITNNGAIANADFSGGITVQGDSARIVSTGTIIGGDTSVGIQAQGDNSTVTGTGRITVGPQGAGFAVNGTSNTITNGGTITGGDSATGIAVFGDSNTVTNSGIITVGDGFALGMDISGFGSGSGNRIVNTGTINVGAGGTGILISNDGTLFNSGTINAATGFAAIEFCNCSANSSLTIAPSSVINGLVIGTGTQVFQLGGAGTGTFNLSLIGAGQQYDGFGTFNKVDTSIWTVTGIGNQSWTVLDGQLIVAGTINGGVAVSGGRLAVNGNIIGAVTVNAGGTLGGTGTVGNTSIDGGALSPGNSVGTITINGNLVLTAAASYIVEVGAVTADRTIVTGTATIAGTVQASFVGPLLQRYTILTASGGVIGTFGALAATGLPAGFSARLTYDPGNVYLNLTAALGGGVPLNRNQQNVATSLNTFFNGGGALPDRFGTVFGLTGTSLRSALTQLSGEIATQSSQAAFNSVDYFLNLMLDPFVSSRGGDVASTGPGANQYASEEVEAGAYAARRKPRSPSEQDAYAAMAYKAVARDTRFDRRWSAWGAGYGGALKASGNDIVGSRDASTRAYGFAAGTDYRLSPDTLVGFALSGGATNFSLAQGGGGRSDVFQAGAFVRHNIGQAYVKGAVAYGWHDVTTDRTIGIAGIDQMQAKFNANTLGGRAEGGYRFATPWLGVTPYAAAQATTYFLPGYGEQATLGLNTFALTYSGRDVTTARTELGLRTDKSFARETAIVTLRGRAAWAHYYDDDRSLTATFQALPGTSFVVTGAAPARDVALVSASADAKWMNGFSLAGVFEGEFSDRTRGYAGKGVVRYSW